MPALSLVIVTAGTECAGSAPMPQRAPYLGAGFQWALLTLQRLLTSTELSLPLGSICQDLKMIPYLRVAPESPL